MPRQRVGQPAALSSFDNDDEDDAFAALSRKNKRVKSETKTAPQFASADSTLDIKSAASTKDTAAFSPFPASMAQTSSTKRHHKPNEHRQHTLDAVLLELSNSATDAKRTKHKASRQYESSESKGSFVEPGEEHWTTNLFVGNLSPSITEEELTDLFRQFGDLYSVKIMWPRQADERSRSRHTGFVCFMNRRDAEDALEACNESDPFGCGYVLKLGWGKDVRKLLRRDRCGSVIVPILQQPWSRSISNKAAFVKHDDDEMEKNIVSSDTTPTLSLLTMDTNVPTICVQIPHDARRSQFISTIASFVAKDGSELEKMLMHREHTNPAFRFLFWPHLPPTMMTDHDDAQEQIRQEHIFYKWRIYSFCQGDTFSNWRTEPFVMFAAPPRPDTTVSSPHHGDGGSYRWIPPPMDPEAAQREQSLARERDEAIVRQKQQRQMLSTRRNYMTGRQLEQLERKKRLSKNNEIDGIIRLTEDEWLECDQLFRRELCASRSTICDAMAFCFEKSAAYSHISSILEESLLETTVDVGTKIARLYLLSDILFNTQQPGVRNAFRYRDAIEKMAPNVLSHLHDVRQSLGRLTQQKLNSAVRSVLAAWTRWGVYNPIFLNELDALYEGRELVVESQTQIASNGDSDRPIESVEGVSCPVEADEAEMVRPIVQGHWSSVDAADVVEAQDTTRTSNFVQDSEGPNGVPIDDVEIGEFHDRSQDNKGKDKTIVDNAQRECHVHPSGSGTNKVDMLECIDADGEPINVNNVNGESTNINDLDGGPADSGDRDGKPLEDNDADGRLIDVNGVNGESIDDGNAVGKLLEDGGADGKPIDVDDVDGDLIDADDIDGEPIDVDVDGKPIDDNDVDGEPIDDGDVDSGPIFDDGVDGEPLKDDDADSEPVYDQDVDGEPIENGDTNGEPADIDDADGEPLDIGEVDGDPLDVITGQPNLSN